MPLFGVKRITLNGKEWYAEASLVRAFKCTGVRGLRDKFGNDFTFFALSPAQRQQLIDEGHLPKSKCSVLVSCDDVDSYLERNVEGRDSDAPSAVNGNNLQTARDNEIIISDDIPSMPVLHHHEPPVQSDPFIADVKMEPVDEHNGQCSCHCDNEEDPSEPVPNDESDHQKTPQRRQYPTPDSSSIPGKRSRLSYQPSTPSTSLLNDVKEERRFICDSCPFFVEFPNEATYLRHMDMAHLANPSVCQAQSIVLPPASTEEDKETIAASQSTSPSVAGYDSTTGAEVYTCKMCSFNFNSQRGLRLHQSITRHLDSYMKCRHCTAVFAAEVELDKHMNEFHSFRCTAEGCSSVFTDGRKLLIHVDENHESKAFCCPVCFTMFRSRNGYGLHMKATCPGSDSRRVTNGVEAVEGSSASDSSKKFICDICEKSFAFSLTLLYHKRSFHQNEPSNTASSAEVADVVTEKWTPLVVQLGDDQGERYACRICGHLFSKKELLRAHEYGHIGIRPYKCNQCGRAFTSSAHLWRHKRSHATNAGGLAFKCDYCSASFSWRVNWRRHMDNFHSNNNNASSESKVEQLQFGCDICERYFTSAFALKIHKTYHTRSMKGANAVSSDQERVGRTVTVGFKCDQCEKTFSSAKHLREHMDRHAGVRRNVCDRCGKTFTYSSALNTHRRLPCSSNELKFSCRFCQDAFSLQRALSLHIARVHSENKNDCWKCGEKFETPISLKRHLQTVHPSVKADDEGEEGQIMNNEQKQEQEKALSPPPQQYVMEDDGPPPLYPYQQFETQ